jgi:hypothetical protein
LSRHSQPTTGGPAAADALCVFRLFEIGKEKQSFIVFFLNSVYL